MSIIVLVLLFVVGVGATFAVFALTRYLLLRRTRRERERLQEPPAGQPVPEPRPSRRA